MAKSWSELESQVSAAFKGYMNSVVEKTYKHGKENTDDYESVESPKNKIYERTSQICESFMLDNCSIGKNSAVANLSWDTDYRYKPSGRDTETIYDWANTGGLHGKSGFVEKTHADIESTISSEFPKFFK